MKTKSLVSTDSAGLEKAENEARVVQISLGRSQCLVVAIMASSCCSLVLSSFQRVAMKRHGRRMTIKRKSERRSTATVKFLDKSQDRNTTGSTTQSCFQCSFRCRSLLPLLFLNLLHFGFGRYSAPYLYFHCYSLPFAAPLRCNTLIRLNSTRRDKDAKGKKELN